jgi:hypothetical protein
MDTNLIQIIGSVILSGGASAYSTEILKSPYIKMPAERYPRITAFVLSIVTSAMALAANGVDFATVLDSPGLWASTAFATFLVAVLTYNQAIRER